MSASGPNVGFPMAITFNSSFFGFITSVDWDGYQRSSIDTSNMSVATPFGRTFLPGVLIDPGTLSVELLLEPNVIPPLSSAAETITVTFPKKSNTTAATWACSGFLQDFKWTAPMDDKMTATGTIKFTGNVTVTAGS